jgi:tetratricopeptide (TPR) repeat protein
VAAAGDIYLQKEKYHDAGKCFEESKQWTKAVSAYEKDIDISKALFCCSMDKHYDRAVEVMISNSQHLAEDKFETLLQEYAKKGAMYYNSRHNVKKVMEFVHYFSTMQEKKKFLKKYKHDAELLKILLKEGCDEEAAGLYENTFQLYKAASCYERAEETDNAVRGWLTVARQAKLIDDY